MSFLLGGLLSGLGQGMVSQDKVNRDAETKRQAALLAAKELAFNQQHKTSTLNETIRHNKATEEAKISGASNSDIAAHKFMTAGLSPEDELKSRRIDLGLDPRATGSSALTIANSGQTEKIAESQAAIEGAKSGAKETEKLKSQLKLKPEVEKAVKRAQELAKVEVESDTKARSNKRAYDVYDAAMRGLASSLGDTFTGPGVKLMPAITANAQIAQGAVAVMAPVLKKLFRVSGEGTFTDKDQALLLEMLPDRGDHPEAIAAKLNHLDMVIRMHLDQGPQVDSSAAQPSSLSTEDQQALDWANSNPNDPRAAQILQLLGK